MGEFGRIGDPADAGLYSGAGSFEHSVRELFRVIPEVNIVHLAITLLSCFIVFFGLFSGLIKERIFIGEAIIATLFGIAFSGYSAGIFAPRTWSEGHHFDEMTLELTRIVIALSVFAVGVELPKAYILRHWRSLVMLLGPIMLFGWLISGALMYAIIPGLEFLPALVVAAGVTPTDPILASSVVGKGKFAQEHVPAHIRHLLQAESGSNDGAAFPFLYLAMFLLLRDQHTVGQAIGWWLVLVVLYQIVLGVFIGSIVGILARKLLKFSKRRELIDRESMVAMYVALALLVTGITTLAGSDDLLAAFACGTAFAWDDWFTESIEESNFSSTIDLLANCAMFIYLGATMPFSAWNNHNLTLTPWRLVLLAISILTLRRLPSMFLLSYWIPDIKTRREAVFAGHFGPIGVGAIFISTLAASKLPTPAIPPQTRLDVLALSVQPITYFLVLSSILIHGLTISFFSLGRRVHSRVTSMTRTFTAASGNGDEPSWMSRVKRARVGEEIVVNRDDDDEVERAEKGIPVYGEKTVDLGTLALSDSTPSGSSKSFEEETERERENDEHPLKDILAEGMNRDERKEKSKLRHATIMEDDEVIALEGGDMPAKLREHPRSPTSAKEQRFCKPGETRSWKEGHKPDPKIVIDHNDGGDPEVVDIDPSAAVLHEAKDNPDKSLMAVPHADVEAERDRAKDDKFDSTDAREESAIKKAAMGMLRRGSIAAATEAAFRPLIKPFDDGLTPAQREEKQRLKLLRDEWCRKEKHYRETSPTAQEWREGSVVVTETGGDKVAVRELTEEERNARAAKHLAALKALGLGGLEQELNKLVKIASRDSGGSGAKGDYFSASGSKGKGKADISGPAPRRSPPLARARSPPPAPAPQPRPRSPSPSPARSRSRSSSRSPSPPPMRPKGTGLSLSRTERIEPESDDEAPGQTPIKRETSPTKTKGNATVNVMRQLFKRQPSHSTEEPEPRGRTLGPDSAPDSRSTSPERSIRFAAADKPARNGATPSGGRALPVVGASLSVRRHPTQPK